MDTHWGPQCLALSKLHTCFGFSDTDTQGFWTAVASIVAALLLLAGLVKWVSSLIHKRRQHKARQRERSKALIREFEEIKELRDEILKAASERVYPLETQRKKWRPVIDLLDKIGQEVHDGNADMLTLFKAIGSEYVRQAKALELTIEEIRKRHIGLARLSMEEANSRDLNEFKERLQQLGKEKQNLFPYVCPLADRWDKWLSPRPRSWIKKCR
jgi:predicted  nucleic acid-binding Zn-ribbon protein